MKSVDSLLGVLKAILARAGAAVTGVLAFPGVLDIPSPLRAALVAAAAWLTGSAVWLAKNRDTIDKVANDVQGIVVKVDPTLAAKVGATVGAVTAKAETDPLVTALLTWADSADSSAADAGAVTVTDAQPTVLSSSAANLPSLTVPDPADGPSV